MQSASKFSNASSTPLLRAAGNQTKLFEMLVLDDEEISELELTGQTGELKLDDIATMSVKELRAALRESRQDTEAKDKLLADKNAALDKARSDARRIAKLPPNEITQRLLTEAAVVHNDALGCVRGNLRAALNALLGDSADHTAYMAGMVGQLVHELALLREEFSLPDVSNAADAALAAEVAQWSNS